MNDKISKLLTPRAAANVAADGEYPPAPSDETLAPITMDENCEITCQTTMVMSVRESAR